MQKKTMIIWTLVGTLLSLAVILMSYFGVIRYITLQISSPEKYIENYRKLEKADDGRVVVSFSARAHEINHLRPMINSLLDQTVKVNQLALVVQLGDKTKIPEWLKKVVNVFPAGKDYGQGLNLIPILLKEKECDTIIIALENDIVYGVDFIEKMIEASKNNPGSVLKSSCNNAILVKPEYYDCEVIMRNKETYDGEWFIQQAKKAQVVTYTGNYKKI